MVTVKIKYLQEMPPLQRASQQAAGFDLQAAQDCTLPPHGIVVVPTAIACALPPGYEAQIRARSGLATEGIFVVNAPGTIDADYRGEIKVILGNLTDQPFRIQQGQRIAQIVFAQLAPVTLQPVSHLDPTPRGQDGLGSTGL